MSGVATDVRVERTRDAVLAAARRLLLEEGWDAVTHLRVAAASGVSRATVYRHWPSGTDLLHDVLRREAEMSHRQPVGRLREDLVAELDALRRQLGLPALAGVLAVLIERSLHDPELARVKRSVVSEVSREHLRTHIGVRLETDVVEPGDLPRYQLKTKRIFDRRSVEDRPTLDLGRQS